MSFSEVDKVYDRVSFRKRLREVDLSWATGGVTVHHTAAPSLAQRPKGFTIQHMRNIQSFYEKELGWSRGPHLFTDEDQIFGMSPLSERGIHAVSFNKTHIGVEALGNYDSEDPKTGRGLQVWETTACCVAQILAAKGMEPSTSTINFHRDDPKTKKTCPGTQVDKAWFIGLVTKFFLEEKDLERKESDRIDAPPVKPQPADEDLPTLLSSLEKLLKKILPFLK